MVPVFTNVCVYICDTNALKGTLVNTLKKARPTLSVAVPRLYEKMAEQIQKTLNQATGVKKSLIAWARRVGYETCMTRQYGQTFRKAWGYWLGGGRGGAAHPPRVHAWASSAAAGWWCRRRR